VGDGLDADLDTLQESGVTRILTLLSDEELSAACAVGIRSAAEARHIRWRQVPVGDYGVPNRAQAELAVGFLREGLDAGELVFVHCYGGLGRAGTIAACVLVSRGLAPDTAIDRVREARSLHAIEVSGQESFVHAWERMIR
jgi:ADP-ribosyl-[dinitrogen reductase] hydrolase